MKAASVGLTRAEPVRVSADSPYLGDRTDPVVRRARREVLARLRKSLPATVIPIELLVELNGSCVAEILTDALLGIVRGEFPGRYLLGCDLTGHVTWDADAALRKESDNRGEKLAMVWQALGGELELIGSVDRQVERTYHFLTGRMEEGATARHLAEADEISIQAASNRLSKANRLGLIHAADLQPASGGGTEYVYIPVG